MRIKNNFFIILKTIWREKSRSLVTVALMSAVLIFIILAFELLNFLSVVGDDFTENNADCRCLLLNVTDYADANDIIAMYKDKDYADIVIRRSRYNTGVIYKGEDVDCLLNLKACAPSSMPKVTHGTGLDFNEKNQVILPQEMILYASDGSERVIDATKLVGKQITCSSEVIDYVNTFGKVEDDIVYGGKPKKSKLYTLTVTGTYDNTVYYQKAYTAFITSAMADSMHLADIEDKTGENMFSSVLVMADSMDNMYQIRDLASENDLTANNLTAYDFKSYLIPRILAYIVIFIMLAICIRIANNAIKSDMQDNATDYVMLGAYGYSNDTVRSMITFKYIMLYTLSAVISVFVSLFMTNNLSELLYKLHGKVYNIEFYFGVVGWIFIIFILVTIFTVVSLSMSLFSCTVRDVVKD